MASLQLNKLIGNDLAFDGRVPYIPSAKNIGEDYIETTEDIIYSARLSASYITSVNWKGSNQPFLSNL